MGQVGFEILRRFEVADNTLVLRRYLNQWKFTQLVESKCLYFAPASLFADELEGHYTNLDYRVWDEHLLKLSFDNRARAMASDAKALVAQHNRKAVVISCWTAGIEEDRRMWTDYGQNPEAVAVETIVGRLRYALGPEFLIIPVRYLDFDRRAIPKDHSLQPFFFKRDSFSWEREVRVVGEMEVGKRIESPRLVPIEFKSVFRRVVISPYASPEYRHAVGSVLHAASLSVPVHESALKGNAA
jgi:hypothetical protein